MSEFMYAIADGITNEVPEWDPWEARVWDRPLDGPTFPPCPELSLEGIRGYAWSVAEQWLGHAAPGEEFLTLPEAATIKAALEEWYARVTSPDFDGQLAWAWDVCLRIPLRDYDDGGRHPQPPAA